MFYFCKLFNVSVIFRSHHFSENSLLKGLTTFSNDLGMNVINELEKSLGYIKVEDYLRNIGKRRKSFPSLLNISHAVI